MGACPTTTREVRSNPPAVPQLYPDWEVAALSDPRAVHELSDRLKAEGVAERRLVVIGPAAFLLFWR